MSCYAHPVTEADILASAFSSAISAVWHPVLLYRNDCFVGMGTLYRNEIQEERIVTAGHLFQNDGQSYLWSFRRLHPLAGYREEIATAAFIPGADFLDMAFCVPGKQVLIRGFCPSHMGAFETSNFRCMLLPQPIEIRSLVSGKAALWGGTVECGLVMYAVIPWNSLPGDSGTGFVGVDGELFVLKGSVEIEPEDYSVIGVPAGTRHVSFLLGTGFV